MFLECEAVVFLVGVAISLRGSSEHDCRVFSTSTRRCSTNHDRQENEDSIQVTTIYNKYGEVVLKWHGSTMFSEDQPTAPPTVYHHLVPESNWDLQPIFWKRRKRHVKKLRGTLATCNCTMKGDTKASKRNINKHDVTLPPREQKRKEDERQSNTTGCVNGFRSRYGAATPAIGHIIKRVTTRSFGQCAIMCEMEFVTQIDCVAIAYSNSKTPDCILLSSLPKRTAHKADYTIYTGC